MNWPYLELEPFKIRSVLAAHFLKDCSEIVELGGYKTPISDFVTGKKVTVLDKLLEEKHFLLHWMSTAMKVFRIWWLRQSVIMERLIFWSTMPAVMFGSLLWILPGMTGILFLIRI